MSNNRLFTDEQEAYLRQHQWLMSSKDAAEMMNRQFGLNVTPLQIKAWRRHRKVNSGLTGQWKTGQEPWNKGKPMSYHSEESKARAKTGCFKKGSCPHNTDPIGTRKVLTDGYVWVKLHEHRNPTSKTRNWRQEHIVNWEKANGPLKPDERVIHKNGDKTDNRIENLQAVNLRSIPWIRYKLTGDKEIDNALVAISEVRNAIADAKEKLHEL